MCLPIIFVIYSILSLITPILGDTQIDVVALSPDGVPRNSSYLSQSVNLNLKQITFCVLFKVSFHKMPFGTIFSVANINIDNVLVACE